MRKVTTHTIAWDSAKLEWKVFPITVAVDDGQGSVLISSKEESSLRLRFLDLVPVLKDLGIELAKKNVYIKIPLEASNLEGSDWAICAALMECYGVVPEDYYNNYVFVGEIGIDGEIRAVPASIASFGVYADGKKVYISHASQIIEGGEPVFASFFNIKNNL